MRSKKEVKLVLGAAKKPNQIVVDLGKGIFARTELPESNVPALRSGFAGYPANPRWSAHKFHAWKVGRQWRRALKSGDLKVRDRDAMLVAAIEATPRLPATEAETFTPVAMTLEPCSP